MGWKLGLVLAIGWVLGDPSRAWAHGANISYRTTEAIEIQAVYDTGEPLAAAQVTLYAPEDPATAWLTGMTDEQGRFWFRPDPEQPGDWEVTVRQAGHGDILVIPVEPTDLDPAPRSGSSVISGARSDNASFSLLQKGVMVGAILWGCVGTALFFSRSRS